MPVLVSEVKLENILTFPEGLMPSGRIQQVDAALVICFDPRLWMKRSRRLPSLVQLFVDQKGWESWVPITEPGSFKVLSSLDPADQEARRSLLSRIQMEIKLHRPKVFALCLHTDCAAYDSSRHTFGQGGEIERFLADVERVADSFGSYFEQEQAGTRLEFYIFDALGIRQVVISS